MFPPGRAREATSPSSTGSPMAATTMGVVVVACWIALAAGVLEARIRSSRHENVYRRRYACHDCLG